MAKDIALYDVEDFVFDESFQHWVNRSDKSAVDFWENYIRECPHKVQTMEAARELLLNLQKNLPEEADVTAEIWKDINARTRPDKLPVKRRLIFKWATAAAVVLLAIAGGLYVNNFISRPSVVMPSALAIIEEAQLREKTNTSRDTISLRLPDGSKIDLLPGASLTYPVRFDGDTRTIRLTGEGVFDVSHDASKPFIIYAGGTVTRVWGTRFVIKANNLSPDVDVKVISGKVSVYTRERYEQGDENEGVFLTGNQSVEFLAEKQVFRRSIVEAPVILETQEQLDFDFRDKPVSEVFRTLQEAYGPEFVYDAKLIEGRTITVSLEDEDFFEKLEIICSTLRISYYMEDGKVFLK